jgi:hypothetical protein
MFKDLDVNQQLGPCGLALGIVLETFGKILCVCIDIWHPCSKQAG